MLSLSSVDLFGWLWWCSTAASCLALLRIGKTGLWRAYRALACYLLVDTAGNLILHFLTGSMSSYRAALEIAMPLSWAALIWVAFDLYDRLSAGLNAKRFGVWLLLAMLVASVLASIGIGQYCYPKWAGIMAELYWARQGVAFSLMVFVLMAYRFFNLHSVSVPRSRNLTRHLRITACLCTGFGIQAALVNLTGWDYFSPMQSLSQLGFAVCYLCWALGLTAVGEARDFDPIWDGRSAEDIDGFRDRAAAWNAGLRERQ